MKPVIFGIKGKSLSEEEITFFLKHKPAGFIIFKRNIESKSQLTELCASLTALFPEREVLILIDQEGGRVQRLTEPHAKKYPAPKEFSDLIDTIGMEAALRATYDSNYEMALELKSCGINVNCTPVADLSFIGANSVIGDRSFGSDPSVVIAFCEQVIKAHLNAGVEPIIKHIPGHGRALADSHFALPILDTPLVELEATDFVPFKELGEKCRFAMTAHIVYNCLDTENTATLSSVIIDYVRKNIGFKGEIITDCITMKALPGTYAEKAKGSIASGCDYVLHCNGVMEEMLEIAESLD